jgi:DHA1 family tetracycline resistance protein-like MFS transporter
MTPRQARFRFLLLLALRWLPVGLELPILVLLPLDRGLTLAQAGLAASLQGFVVLALELPTGGLSDSWGRRPVLAASAVVSAVSLSLFAMADTFAMFAAVFVLQGVFRALDSGPLEAWYVDAMLADDPKAKVDRGLSAAGAVTGVAMGAGALVAGGIVAWVRVPGVPTLALPVWLGLFVQLMALVGILLFVHDQPHPAGRRRFLASLRDVPRVIVEGAGLVRRSRVLLALIGVELFWGFGMVTFEVLVKVRLAEEVGGNDKAAAIAGPAGTVAWLAFAVGSGLVPLLSTRIGLAMTGAVLRVAQGVAVLGMGLLAGPVGLLAGYLVAYAVHGASNPVHLTLLNRQVTSGHRSTVMSMNSMVAQPAGSLGTIVLTALATGVSTSFAIVVGAVVLAVAAPLYLPAARAERRESVSV